MRRFTVDLSVSSFQRMSLQALTRYFRGAAIPTRHLKPLDYALTCTGVAAAAPVIGRYLEPLGTLVAAGAWVRRNAPGSAAPKLPAGGTVVLDVEEGGIEVPSFLGKSLRVALEAAQNAGLDIDAVGSGVAREQMPAAGAHVAAGSRITVHFGR